MSALAYRALDVIHRGLAPAVQPGEIVPETYVTDAGEPAPYDFERLLALGVVEAATAAPGGASGGAKSPSGAPRRRHAKAK